jgi:hypothetical protein
MSARAVRCSQGLQRRLLPSVCWLATFLGGCSTLGPLPSPLASGATPWGPLPFETRAPALDPQHQYLRVTQGQQVGWLVYGGIHATPRPGLEAWYSADGGVLRLLNGRLVGYASAALQWSETHSGAPNQPGDLWDPKRSHDFERWVDRMPGWWVNEVQKRRLTAAGAQAPGAHRLLGSSKGLVWWRETAAPSNPLRGTEGHAQTQAKATPASADSPPPTLQDTWYAVDTTVQPPRVVYGQQCLAGSQPLVCLSWQRWPAATEPVRP